MVCSFAIKKEGETKCSDEQRAKERGAQKRVSVARILAQLEQQPQQQQIRNAFKKMGLRKKEKWE